MILAVLALVHATIQPPSPKVGDLITVEFSSRVVLDRSADYEVVSHAGTTAVVRTFTPRTFVITGTADGERFRTTVPVTSVLKPNDAMQPAPLAAPQPIPYPPIPFLAIAIAAWCAIAAWLAVWLRARQKAQVVVPVLSAGERFQRAVLALRHDPRHPRRWAALADETRAYFAATRPHLGSELTTTEVLARVDEDVVARILRQGDLEKFSPRGAGEENFEEIAAAALHLVIPSVSEGPGWEGAR